MENTPVSSIDSISPETFFSSKFHKAKEKRKLGICPDSERYVIGVLVRAATGKDPLDLIEYTPESLFDYFKLNCGAYPATSHEDLQTAKPRPQNLGDTLLFLSGFFPERLLRRNKIGFYHEIGATAYLDAAYSAPKSSGLRIPLEEIGENFPRVAGALNQMRLDIEFEGIKTIEDVNRVMKNYGGALPKEMEEGIRGQKIVPLRRSFAH